MELELLIPIIDNFVHSSAFYQERLSQVADIAHLRPHARTGADALARRRIGEATLYRG